MIYWPVVQQRLVALLPTLPGWTGVVVHDGQPRLNRNAKESISVGWSTFGPQGGTRGSGLGDSGSWSNTEETVQTMRAENGSVLCELVVWGGDEQSSTTYRQRAFDLVDELDQAIRDDETLGVLPRSSTTSLGAEVISGQDKTGASTRLIVSVDYFVRS